MRSSQDKQLKLVISFLRELTDTGTLEQGQKEALTKAISNLRKAVRGSDPAKIRAAVGHVAEIFLRANGR